MPTRNINLTERLDRFVDASISTGRYQNASEVIRDALRLRERRSDEYELRLQRLRAAAQEGEAALARGDYQDIAPDELDDYLAALD